MSVLEMENVSKSFDGISAVESISMGFEDGKITGLIGPNGAGKTTLFNLITGFIHPDEGEIYYHGRNITNLHPWQIARLGVGRLFQDIRVFDRMIVLDNILTAFKKQTGESALMSMIVPWKVAKEKRVFNKQAQNLLEFVSLANKADDLGENLSYGEQKLLAIARLLAAEAEVLLLDEPTAGVAPHGVKTLLELIRKLAKEGKTVVVIEHNMNIVTEVADWVYFMDEGQIASFGIPSEVLIDPEIRAVYVGL